MFDPCSQSSFSCCFCCPTSLRKHRRHPDPRWQKPRIANRSLLETACNSRKRGDCLFSQMAPDRNPSNHKGCCAYSAEHTGQRVPADSKIARYGWSGHRSPPSACSTFFSGSQWGPHTPACLWMGNVTDFHDGVWLCCVEDFTVKHLFLIDEMSDAW